MEILNLTTKKSNSYLHYIYCEHLNTNLNLVLSKDLNKELIREKEERLNNLFGVVSTEASTVKEFTAIFDDPSYQYLYRCMRYDEKMWFFRMIKIVENLPISLTISDSNNVKGFPLIYVNKQFEIMTKYTPLDI